ncbi:hypothetical protein AABM17_2290 [Neisseria musculi]|uniref:Uncharacterized protein n=1 Tax=Neisseria musculi TaxID=1815583 RepID=A0A7H1MBZ9_9NEIS|nr:hypothetical protein H7A79_2289 [Neisseria musculi]
MQTAGTILPLWRSAGLFLSRDGAAPYRFALFYDKKGLFKLWAVKPLC